MSVTQKSLAELVAELEDPVPQDIDPEQIGAPNRGSDDEKLDDAAGRGHYEDVGKSKLRQQPKLSLGPQYSGSKVSRKDLDQDEEIEDNPFEQKIGSEFSDDSANHDGDYDDPNDVNLAVHDDDDDDEEIDSDEAFEDGEEELYRKKGFMFKKSENAASKSRQSISEQDGSSDNDDGSGYEGIASDSDESSPDGELDELQIDDDSNSEVQFMEDYDTDASMTTVNEDESDQGSDLDATRAMRAIDQRNAVSGLSGVMKSEIDKGVAIKKQYVAFDALVGTRVHLQKSLIAANSLSAVQRSDQGQDILAKAAEGAENAAIEVLNSLTSLLHSIQSAHLAKEEAKTVLGKRPFSATISTSSIDIQQAISASHLALKPQRRQILAKWESKTHATTLSKQNGLGQKPTEDGLVVTLDGQLRGSNQDRLIQKTRIARSCAPIQQAANSQPDKKPINNGMEDGVAARKQQDIPNVSSVYDDADFYALVLRELIDHKKTYTKHTSGELSGSTLIAATTPTNLLRGNRTKRANLDTKASKGRKMKYTVHERLQNFMAPVDLGSWERKQAEELFAGLLGRRIAGVEEADAVDVVVVSQADTEMQGLRLFGDR